MEEFKQVDDLKGGGPPEYYVGAEVYRDDDTRWCISCKTYIKNVCAKIEKLMEVNLKNVGSPLVPGDHPEMDETELLVGNEISQYQMLCGSAQWAVTLG